MLRPRPATGDGPDAQNLESVFAPLVPRRFGGLVAVAADGVGTYDWSAGTWGTLPPLDRDPVRDDRKGDRLEPVFQIASITKVFTALLLADAASSGLAELDEPVEDVLDVRLRVGGRPVTLRDLATHRSGLPFVPESMKHDPTVDHRDPYRTYDEDKLLAAAETAHDKVRPGRKAPYRYSNFGFALLGSALSRRIGTSYADALRDRVLVPAGLVETSIRPTNPRALRIDEHGELVAAQAFAAFAPAGGLWMSASDLGRWLTLLTEAVSNGVGENSPGRHHARQLVRTTTAPQIGSRSKQIGLAWRLSARDGIAWHSGGVPGASSFAGLNQRHAGAIGVFAFGNSAGHLDRAAIRALTDLQRDHRRLR